MTSADRLRVLVAEATPGPWESRRWGYEGDEWPERRVSVGRAVQSGEAITCSPRYGNLDQDLANARLIALAPQLAELVADMGEAAAAFREAIRAHGDWLHPGKTLEPAMTLDSVLARLDALFSKEEA